MQPQRSSKKIRIVTNNAAEIERLKLRRNWIDIEFYPIDSWTKFLFFLFFFYPLYLFSRVDRILPYRNESVELVRAMVNRDDHFQFRKSIDHLYPTIVRKIWQCLCKDQLEIKKKNLNEEPTDRDDIE